MLNKKFFTYILLCANDKLYTGYTGDLNNRFTQHQTGKGSKFTKANKPIKYVYTMEYSTKFEAMKAEYRIKHLTREQKEKLINNQAIVRYEPKNLNYNI
jgi:putative endonuclease